MRLSTKSRYGLRAMIYIARNAGTPTQGEIVAANEGLSVKYLEAILRCLRRADLLRAVRGPGGGYLLGRPADEIRIGDIVMALEDGFAIIPCQRDSSICSKTDYCVARKVWVTVSTVIEATLNSLTLADLTEPDAEKSLIRLTENFTQASD